jgi:hypothetical protein
MRRLAAIIAACAAAAILVPTSASLLSAGADTPAPMTAQIKHFFIIVLENEDAADTFGPSSPARYLSQTLTAQGAYIPNYYGTAHLSLPNYIAMVSGQAPNPELQADCPGYGDVTPGAATSSGQVVGAVGCAFPAGTTQTVANLLEDHGYTWKGYMEDMAAGTPTSCRHPASNSQDTTQTAKVGDQYASRHNPFVYFHSIIDFPTCAANDVDYSQLSTDLQSESTTPSYSFITPNLCHDGHDSPCVSGEPGGLVTADKWLQDNVPQILDSPAYKDHGLLMITFDEAHGGTSPADDGSACCNEPSGPNTPAPGALTGGAGGGKVGAVLLSPCIAPGTVDATPYNHYSMLRSVENFFSLPYLGYSGQAGLSSFGSAVFTRPGCNATTEGGGGGGGGGAGGGAGGGGGGGAAPATLKISLHRKPNPGFHRSCFKIRVTANGQPVAGAEVNLGGKVRRTKPNGVARICRKAGNKVRTLRLRVSADGFTAKEKTLKIVKRRP